MHLVDTPDEVTVHAPSHCPTCGESLAEVPAIRQERRQVVDLPVIKTRVVEHRAATKCCPGCGTETSGTFPAEVKGPVQYGPGAVAAATYLNQAQLLPLERTCEVMEELLGCPMVEGTLENALQQCHGQLAAMPKVRQVNSLKMGWCVSCHTENNAPTDCLICHR